VKLKWNFKSFRKLCYELGFKDSQVYQETLIWKSWCVNQHNELSQNVLNSLYKELEGTGTSIVSFNDNESMKKWFESEIQAVACAHVLNTIVDVSLQIINISLFKKPLSESKVTMGKITEKLGKNTSMSNILKKLEKLEKSYEYSYIRSFDNILKHRRLIDNSWSYHWNQSTGQRKGIRFNQFDYGSTHYPATWATDITDKYKRKINNMICEIGGETIHFLREKKRKLAKKGNSRYALLKYLK